MTIIPAARRRALPALAALLSAVLAALALGVAPAAAAPGDLDTTFGTGGKVLTNFGGFDDGNSIAIQGDGKIVVAGYSPASGSPYDFALARYLAAEPAPTPTPTATPTPTRTPTPTPTATPVPAPGVSGPGLGALAGLLLVAVLWVAWRRRKGAN